MAFLSNLGMTALTLGTIVYLVHWLLESSALPSSLQWAGRRDQVFSKARACFREFFAGLRTLNLGYTQYSKKGQSFVLPDPGFRPQVVVPQEHFRWLFEQPEDVLSVRLPQVKRFAINYLAPMLDYTHDSFLVDTIRKDLTRNLGRLQADVVQDLREGIDTTLGLDDQSWREICLFQAMQAVIFKSTSRVLVGAPLCHNEEYLRSSGRFANWLGIGAVIVGQFVPSTLKPVFGYLIAIPVYIYRRKSFKFLLPVIRERMANIHRKKIDPSFAFEEPKDLITWMVTAVIECESTSGTSPEALAERLLFLILGAIHTAIMTSTNVFLDLASSAPQSRYYQTLREEAAAIFETEENWKDPASLLKLQLADSAIRETLRQNPVLTRGSLRQVMPKDGLSLPDGHHLPQGALIAAPVVPLHYDDRFYTNPNKYDAFRFARKQGHAPLNEDEDGSLAGETSSTGKLQQGLSTTGDKYLAFGYGRHSCPGRWFVAHQLKLLLAYVTLNYEIQSLEKRPLNIIFGDSIVPPQSATIKLS